MKKFVEIMRRFVSVGVILLSLCSVARAEDNTGTNLLSFAIPEENAAQEAEWDECDRKGLWERDAAWRDVWKLYDEDGKQVDITNMKDDNTLPPCCFSTIEHDDDHYNFFRADYNTIEGRNVRFTYSIDDEDPHSFKVGDRISVMRIPYTAKENNYVEYCYVIPITIPEAGYYLLSGKARSFYNKNRNKRGSWEYVDRTNSLIIVACSSPGKRVFEYDAKADKFQNPVTKVTDSENNSLPFIQWYVPRAQYDSGINYDADQTPSYKPFSKHLYLTQDMKYLQFYAPKLQNSSNDNYTSGSDANGNNTMLLGNLSLIADTPTSVIEYHQDYSELPAVYYNMQGVKVDQPSTPGIYVKVAGGKVAKIRIN